MAEYVGCNLFNNQEKIKVAAIIYTARDTKINAMSAIIQLLT